VCVGHTKMSELIEMLFGRADLHVPKKPCIGFPSNIYGTCRRHMANMIEQPLVGGDVGSHYHYCSKLFSMRRVPVARNAPKLIFAALGLVGDTNKQAHSAPTNFPSSAVQMWRGGRKRR